MYEIVGAPVLTGAADATVLNASTPIRQTVGTTTTRDQKARTDPALHRRYLLTTLLFSA
jgi:hypothetical protein